MSEHTPGPWEWRPEIRAEFDEYHVLVSTSPDAPEDPDVIWTDGGDDGEPININVSPEDARLIAAAPRMLRVLEAMLQNDVDYIGESWEEYPMLVEARDAVAAAKGRRTGHENLRELRVATTRRRRW